MSKVVAKFRVEEVTRWPSNNVDDPKGYRGQVRLSPSQDPVFGPSTPCGEIHMQIVGPALKVFEDHLGEKMLVEFTPQSETEG